MFGFDDAIGAGIGIVGGIFQRRAAKKAAEAQQKAAEAAAQRLTEQTGIVNAGITDASGRAITRVNDAATTGADSATAAAKAATDRVDTATGNANKLLDPYAAAGATAAEQLNAGVAKGGDFNRDPTMADIQIDPGYEWRLKQGQAAMERSAAAHGAVGGGGFAKDLADYSQGAASQEFEKAFNRFDTNRKARLGALTTVAGQGQTAATTQGGRVVAAGQYGGDATMSADRFGTGLKTDASKYSGDMDFNTANLTGRNLLDSTVQGNDYRLQGVNAKAAGDVAGSSALWGGVTKAAGSLIEGNQISKLLKRPNYLRYDQMQSVPFTPRFA